MMRRRVIGDGIDVYQRWREFELACTTRVVHSLRDESRRTVLERHTQERRVSHCDNLMHLGMALLESGEKDRARAVFRKAKSFKSKGSGLAEKILEQVRSTTKLIDRLHQKRRRATTK